MSSSKYKSFAELLKEAQEMSDENSKISKLPLEPLESTQLYTPTDEFLENKNMTMRARNLDKIPISELTEREKDLLKLRNTMASARMTKRMSELGVDYNSKKLPKMLEDAKELLKKLKNSGADILKEAGEGKKIKPSIGGLIAGLGLSAYAPKSKAAAIAQRALEEGDPTSVLFPSGAGEGEEEELKKMKAEQLQEKELSRIFENDKKKLEQFQQKLQEPLKAENLLTAPPIDISELGQKDSPDLEEMDNLINYEDYLNKRKKIMGYE